MKKWREVPAADRARLIKHLDKLGLDYCSFTEVAMAAIMVLEDASPKTPDPNTEMHCPLCFSPVTGEMRDEGFAYGIPPHTEFLTARVLQGRCETCEMVFTDWRAEEVRTEVVRQHIAEKKRKKSQP